MRAYGLVLLIAAAFAAPQGEPSEASGSSEAKQPKARQAFGQEQFVFQSAPQFGAKLAPAGAQYSQYTQGIPAGAQVVYLQGGYQQPQYSYTPSQQIAYIAGAPAQSIVSSPAQAYYSGSSYYSGASAQFAQPQANLVAVKKAATKPSFKVVAQQPQAYKTQVTTYKAQAAPAPAVFYKPQPAPASFYKAQPAVASAAFYKPQPAVASAAFYKAPAPVPAPAPVLKVAAPAPAAAAVQYSSAGHAEPYHVIVKQFEDNNFDGSFNYNYETDHGIAVESSGYVKNAGTENEVQVIQGSYTYYSPEGVPITTTYIADENGFQVQGDHLPVPPPLPEAIAKAIDYQRSLPPSPEELAEQAAAAARQ